MGAVPVSVVVVVRAGRAFVHPDLGDAVVGREADLLELFELTLDHPDGGRLQVGQSPGRLFVQLDGEMPRDDARHLLGEHAVGLLEAAVELGRDGLEIGQVGPEVESLDLGQAPAQALQGLVLSGRQIEVMVPVVTDLHHLEAVLLRPVQLEVAHVQERDVLEPQLLGLLGRGPAEQHAPVGAVELALNAPSLPGHALELVDGPIGKDVDHDQDHDQGAHRGLGHPQRRDIEGVAGIREAGLLDAGHDDHEGYENDQVEVGFLVARRLVAQDEEDHGDQAHVGPAVLGEDADGDHAQQAPDEGAQHPDQAPVQGEPGGEKVDRDRADRGPVGLAPVHVERDRVDDRDRETQFERFYDPSGVGIHRHAPQRMITVSPARSSRQAAVQASEFAPGGEASLSLESGHAQVQPGPSTRLASGFRVTRFLDRKMLKHHGNSGSYTVHKPRVFLGPRQAARYIRTWPGPWHLEAGGGAHVIQTACPAVVKRTAQQA